MANENLGTEFKIEAIRNKILSLLVEYEMKYSDIHYLEHLYGRLEELEAQAKREKTFLYK